jgi:hypothetical protein
MPRRPSSLASISPHGPAPMTRIGVSITVMRFTPFVGALFDQPATSTARSCSRRISPRPDGGVRPRPQ